LHVPRLARAYKHFGALAVAEKTLARRQINEMDSTVREKIISKRIDFLGMSV
jgi:hypothetical protein